jgi:hypothetical protein
METRDFIFYREEVTAQQPITGHLRLFNTPKKITSDKCKPPKDITSPKRGNKGLIAPLERASNQASQSQYTSNLIATKGGV